MGKRLSSCCKCGPKGTAVHEMGKCPQLFIKANPVTPAENYRPRDTQPIEDRIKPPWEK